MYDASEIYRANVSFCFSDEKSLLGDEYDEEGFGPTAVRKADVIPTEKLMEAEAKLLFIPSSAPCE